MSHKNAIISGIKWSSFSFFVRRVLAFLTNIVLAHMLSPNDFGLVAMASVALGFVDLFKDLGTGTAVIQRKEISDTLLSSIFWINAGLGILVSASLYLAAPAIGLFYRTPDVAPLMQVLSFSFFISTLSIVQSSLLSRQMAFDQLAKIELVTAVFSSAFVIAAAYVGFGAMSLVYQPLLNSILALMLLWGSSAWRPQTVFNWAELREVAGYSLSLTGFNIMNYFTRNADNLIIGRYLGAEDLGYYDLAYRLMLYPLQGISAVVSKVMFPLYSKLQDDHQRFCQTYLNAIGAIALISFPLMLGLLAVSEQFILALFGEQWKAIIPLLMIFSPIGAMQSINTTVGSIYQAKGRTDLMLICGVVFNFIYMSAFIIGLNWGVMGVAIAYACAYSLTVAPSFGIAFRLIDLKWKHFIKVLWKPLFCGLSMCLTLIATKYLALGFIPVQRSHPALLVGLVLFGFMLYMALTLLINRRSFFEVLHTFINKA